MLPVLLLAAAVGLVNAATDPCTVASSAHWVSSKDAHACELNVPFNQTRSLAVIDSVIKSLQYYSIETWFINSPNPLIPHHVNIRSLLTDVQKKTASGGYANDWSFNLAITDAYNREQDGHTTYQAACTVSFSYNLPFSIATLAKTPYDAIAYPTFLINYDFPNQGRNGLESYYKGLGIDVRPYDGARILEINGQDASLYLTDLAQKSSITNGLFGAYEDINARYMRLMSRYSADTTTGDYTQEVGRFGSRAFYPGADEVIVALKLTNGTQAKLTVPWAATFVGSGTDTPSFIAQTCLTSSDAAEKRRRTDIEKRDLVKRAIHPPPLMEKIVGVEKLDIQQKLREESSGFRAAATDNYVTPNLTHVAHLVTIDVYQLTENPKVGVVYFQQFEPSDGTDFLTYVNGVSSVLYDGLNALKAAGVKKVIIDNSGNRGGYIYAGAIALWSLWPQDLYPGFPAVFRDGNLTRRESDVASSTDNQNSEYNFRFYRDLNYTLLTSNAQFLDPPVPQTINGVKDAYSHPFFDDFGNGSFTVTNFTTPPFQPEDYVIVANGICASTCSIFSSYLWQKHNVKSAVFGGTPISPIAQFDGGVKGSEVTDYSTILAELQYAGLSSDPAAPQPLPVSASISYNYRNAIPYKQKQNGILEYSYEAGTKKYHFTADIFNKPQRVWELVAKDFFRGLY